MPTSIAPAGSPPGDTRRRMLDAAMTRHQHRPDSLIEVLHIAQKLYGHLDADCLTHVGHSLKVPPSRVYGVATFYHLFSLEPRGAHTCVICMGTACYVNGAASILAAVEQAYRIAPGGTTADGQLSLATARCIGACGLAPVAVFDTDIAGSASVDGTLVHLREWTDHGR